MALYDMQSAAKKINFKGGRNKLMKMLKQDGYMNPDNTAISTLCKSGLFVIKQGQTKTRAGMPVWRVKTLATSDGLSWLTNWAKNHDMLKH